TCALPISRLEVRVRDVQMRHVRFVKIHGVPPQVRYLNTARASCARKGQRRKLLLSEMFPGEGRGPGAGGCVRPHAIRACFARPWTPAFAGALCLSQFAPPELAGRGFWERFDELDLARIFVGSDLGLGVGLEFGDQL